LSIFAVFGAVMGMVIGVGLGWAFIKVLADTGLGNAVVPWGQLEIMLVSSAVVGVVAAIWPSTRAAKTPRLEAIADYILTRPLRGIPHSRLVIAETQAA